MDEFHHLEVRKNELVESLKKVEKINQQEIIFQFTERDRNKVIARKLKQCNE